MYGIFPKDWEQTKEGLRKPFIDYKKRGWHVWKNKNEDKIAYLNSEKITTFLLIKINVIANTWGEKKKF